MMRRYLAATLTLALSLGFAGSVFAATPDASDIEYQRLKERIAQLKQEIGDLQSDNKEIVKNDKKNAKAIKVSGDMRFKFIDQHDGQGTTLTQSIKLRTKYSISKDLMFNASFNFMADNPLGTSVRNTAPLGDWGAADQRYDDFSAADNVSVTQLNVKKSRFMGNNSLTLGRMGHDIGATRYWSYGNGNGYFDGVKVGFGPKENISIAYGNWGAADTYYHYWYNISGNYDSIKHKDLEKSYLIQARQNLNSKTTLYEWILNEVGNDSYYNNEIKDKNKKLIEGNNYKMRGVGIKTKLTQDVLLTADYSKNLAQDAEGLFIRLKYKGASRHVPGSYALGLDYERIEPGNIYSTQLNGVNDVSLGLRDQVGIDTFVLWGQYTFRKNVIMSAFQSVGRKALCDYKDYKKGDSAPAYTRAHVAWYF